MTQTRPKHHPTLPGGRVGIFWVFRGRILAATWALTDGEEYGGSINGRTDHVRHWPQLQRQHPELRPIGYEAVPRGRVLFQQPARRFAIYMDKVLHQPAIKRQILKEFELRAGGTQFFSDAHYTTNPDELDRLFSPP